MKTADYPLTLATAAADTRDRLRGVVPALDGLERRAGGGDRAEVALKARERTTGRAGCKVQQEPGRPRANPDFHTGERTAYDETTHSA